MTKRGRISQGVVDPDASLSSEHEDYDAGRVAAFEAEVDERLQRAQDWLAEDAVLPRAEEEPPLETELPAKARPGSHALMKSLVSIYRSTRREAPRTREDALYRLLVLFAIYTHKYCGESVMDHPVLGCIAECERLRELAAAAPEPPRPAPAAEPQGVQANPITRDMMRNRGIPKLRSLARGRQTPRVRQKERFRKAGLVMRSRGHRARRITARVYDGEAGGIRVGLNRAIDI